MIISNLSELFLYPVADRGIPNMERVPIYVQQTMNLGQYGVMLGHARDRGFAVPFLDNLFWFGEGFVSAGDWIFIYTGRGQPTVNELPQSPGNKMYSVHWGRSRTMFANSNIVPILFRTDAVSVGSAVMDVPQLTGPSA